MSHFNANADNCIFFDSQFQDSFKSAFLNYEHCEYTGDIIISLLDPQTAKILACACGTDGGQLFAKMQLRAIELCLEII